MKKADKCVTCGKGLLEQGSTTFHCPSCNQIIGRCANCREQSRQYQCPNCEFSGP